MGTLIKLKSEVTNPELPVLTEQGILPYYTGIFANRLAEKGIALTAGETDAITAFIDSLKDGGLLGKIGTLYPFIGDANIPLIGNKYLEYTSSDTARFDKVNGKLRGVNSIRQMNNVKFPDLAETDFGIMFGGSMLTKIPSATDTSNQKVIAMGTGSTIPLVQLRIKSNSSGVRKMEICDFYDPEDTETYESSIFNPELEASQNLDNYSFAYGLTNSTPPFVQGDIAYNRTLKRNGVLLANAANHQTTYYIHTDVSDLNVAPVSVVEGYGMVITTLAFFNEILTATESKKFVDALDTFTDAVGKTVTV